MRRVAAKSPNSSLGLEKEPRLEAPFCFNEAFSDNLSLNSIPLLVSVLRPGVGVFFIIIIFLNVEGVGGRFNHLYLKKIII